MDFEKKPIFLVAILTPTSIFPDSLIFLVSSNWLFSIEKNISFMYVKGFEQNAHLKVWNGIKHVDQLVKLEAIISIYILDFEIHYWFKKKKINKTRRISGYVLLSAWSSIDKTLNQKSLLKCPGTLLPLLVSVHDKQSWFRHFLPATHCTTRHLSKMFLPPTHCAMKVCPKTFRPWGVTVTHCCTVRSRSMCGSAQCGRHKTPSILVIPPGVTGKVE